MSPAREYDLIIIGGGPAGMTAGIYAARKKLKTLILTRSIGGQAALSSDIENYTGFAMVSGADLTGKFEQHLEEFKDDVELRLTGGVESIEKVDLGFEVRLDGGEREVARAVIIASGRVPRQLGVEGEEKFLNRGVTYCAWCDGPLFAGRDVAIIGGGNSAVDAALSAAKIAKQIYVINIDTELTAEKLMVDKAKQAHNIRIINQAELKKIEGAKFVNSITILDNTAGIEKDLPVTGVFIEVGSVAATDYLRGLVKCNQDGEILIDKNNMTNIAGIFAAGDVTEVIEKQIIVAAGEGAKAAIAASRWLAKK